MLKINKNNKMITKILFCAAEAAPLAKVGGLADVVGSLPEALKAQGLDARILMPAHGSISLKSWKAKKINSFLIKIDKKQERVNIWYIKVKGTSYYLLQNKNYFSGHVYEGDSISKYLFFARAALKALSLLPFKPQVIHAHDFHAASIITELSTQARTGRPGLVLTIHNLQHQGWTEEKALLKFDFCKTDFQVRDKNISNKKTSTWINLLAAGIKSADKITTVSPTYAKEILTPAYGYGLEKLLSSRRKDLVGILNGIDVKTYNPAGDINLAQKYASKDVVAGKQNNKQAVRAYLKLKEDNSPLFVFIARFSNQKGLDLFKAEDLLNLQKKFPFQLVILGSGEEKYEQMILAVNKQLPDNMRTIIAFDETLAHNLYASANYFLVPSKFEPCGLTQMMAMRYGAVPIVRATGGLKDTVIHEKTGLVFKQYTSQAFNRVLKQALLVYYQQPALYKKMRSDGLRQDWSWQASAPEYQRLYQEI
ncbi:glycogen synthase [Patescibacteria group bacterium]|nr:glycogen synthase [Patescibacteria group bacterium]